MCLTESMAVFQGALIILCIADFMSIDEAELMFALVTIPILFYMTVCEEDTFSAEMRGIYVAGPPLLVDLMALCLLMLKSPYLIKLTALCSVEFEHLFEPMDLSVVWLKDTYAAKLL